MPLKKMFGKKAKSDGPLDQMPVSEPIKSDRRLLIISDVEPKSGPRIAGVNWNSLDEIGNIRDFDDVLLDVSDFPSPKTSRLTDESKQHVEVWKAFDEKFRRDICDEFLSVGGKFIIYGNPNFLRPAQSPFGGWGGSARTSFDSIIPLDFRWDDAKGERVSLADNELALDLQEVLGHLKRYEFALEEIQYYERNTQYTPPPAMQAFHLIPLATNKSRKPVAFALQFFSRAKVGSEGDPSGMALFFPEVQLDKRKILSFLIEDFLGYHLSDTEPRWLSNVRLPDEDVLDSELATLQSEIATLKNKVDDLETRRIAFRKATRLLYETGSELEDAVRDALRELGAMVEEPDDPSKEDGWISVSVGATEYKGVLEIKSTQSATFAAKGLRQLGEWRERGVKRRGIAYKPIFIGASGIHTPFQDRPDPFVHDVVNTAKDFDAALMRAEDLFKCITIHRRGKFDSDLFWTRLFHASGKVDLVGVL